MVEELQLKKAIELKVSADILVNDSKIRGAISLYWDSIRTMLFSKLDKENKIYRSTNEGLVKIICDTNEDEAAQIMLAYIYGIRASWDESYDFGNNNINSIVKKNQDYLTKVIGKIPKEINFVKLRNLLYEKARNDYVISRNYKIAIIALGVIILVLQELVSSISLAFLMINWIYALITIAFIFSNYWYTTKSKKKYKSAERIRQFIFLKELFPNIFDEIYESNIIDDVEKEYIEQTVEERIEQNNPDKYIEDFEEPLKKFVFRLQENSYFTYMLYKRYADILKNRLYIVFLVFLVLFALVIVLNYFNIIISLLVFPKLLPLVISLIFAFDLIENIFSFAKKSEIIKRIDLKIENLIKSEDKTQIWALFDYYNSVLWDAIPIKDEFYNNNFRNLNLLVKNKMNKYKNAY